MTDDDRNELEESMPKGGLSSTIEESEKSAGFSETEQDKVLASKAREQDAQEKQEIVKTGNLTKPNAWCYSECNIVNNLATMNYCAGYVRKYTKRWHCTGSRTTPYRRVR